MCTICNGEYDCIMIYKDNNNSNILSIECSYNYDTEGYDYVDIMINYCPFCGKKL